MSDNEIKDKLIDIITEIYNRSKDKKEPNTELSMTMEVGNFILNVNLNYDIKEKGGMYK